MQLMPGVGMKMLADGRVLGNKKLSTDIKSKNLIISSMLASLCLFLLFVIIKK